MINHAARKKRIFSAPTPRREFPCVSPHSSFPCSFFLPPSPPTGPRCRLAPISRSSPLIEALADAVAKQAEIFRKQSAREWLGKELPDRVGRSLITVDISADKDKEGLTWPIDRAERTLHPGLADDLNGTCGRQLPCIMKSSIRCSIRTPIRTRCRPGPRRALPARPMTTSARNTSGRFSPAGRQASRSLARIAVAL